MTRGFLQAKRKQITLGIQRRDSKENYHLRRVMTDRVATSFARREQLSLSDGNNNDVLKQNFLIPFLFLFISFGEDFPLKIQPFPSEKRVQL